MIVVVASRRDQAARAFAQAHGAEDIRVFTPDDLSAPGWSYELSSPHPGTGVIAGVPVAVSEISGVLTRLATVDESDLPHVIPEERHYVGAEMTAFLAWWLSSLPCPVVNRPVPPALTAPVWSHERWVFEASRLGIPVVPVVTTTHPEEEPGVRRDSGAGERVVTLVGTRCVGDTDPSLTMHAQLLAAAAGVDVLVVRFSALDEARFLSADQWADIRVPAVADAVLEHLEGQRGHRMRP